MELKYGSKEEIKNVIVQMIELKDSMKDYNPVGSPVKVIEWDMV